MNIAKFLRATENTESTKFFHKDQTNLQNQIKLKVDVENDSYFCKEL